MAFEDPKEETPKTNGIERFLRRKHGSDVPSQKESDSKTKDTRTPASDGKTETEQRENLEIFNKLSEIILKSGQKEVMDQGGFLNFIRKEEVVIGDDELGNPIQVEDTYIITVACLKSETTIEALEGIISMFDFNQLPDDIIYPFYFISAELQSFGMNTTSKGFLPAGFLAENGDIMSTRNGFFFCNNGTAYKLETTENRTKRNPADTKEWLAWDFGYSLDQLPKVASLPPDESRFVKLDPSDYEKINRAINQVSTSEVPLGLVSPLSDHLV